MGAKLHVGNAVLGKKSDVEVKKVSHCQQKISALRASRQETILQLEHTNPDAEIEILQHERLLLRFGERVHSVAWGTDARGSGALIRAKHPDGSALLALICGVRWQRI